MYIKDNNIWWIKIKNNKQLLKKGVEPLFCLEPSSKPGAYTNFATSAKSFQLKTIYYNHKSGGDETNAFPLTINL